MKLSTKSRYALRILVDLAQHQEDGSLTTLLTLSSRQDVSLKYLSRLLPQLVKARIIGSVRGAEGGYTLLKKPHEITFLDVIETMEGPFNLTPCSRKDQSCKKKENCTMCHVWHRISCDLCKVFEKYTLQDVIDDINAGVASDEGVNDLEV